MRVLLMGADGFLGRHVAERLLADPAVQLTALGRSDESDVRFDLSSGAPGVLARYLDAVHPGVLINCAGAIRGNARDLTRQNIVAVATICEAMRRSSVGARLVQVGCASEYGPSPAGSSTGEDASPGPAARTASANSPPPNSSSAPASTRWCCGCSARWARAPRPAHRSAGSRKPCGAPCRTATRS